MRLAFAQALQQVHRARRQGLTTPGDGTREDERLVGGVERRALGEQALTGALDLVEDAHTAVPRERELDREVGTDDIDQGAGTLEEGTCTCDLEADEVTDRGTD